MNAADYRLLTGLALAAHRTGIHGAVGELDQQVADILQQSPRWVRETVRVARIVREAAAAGDPVPMELRTLPWRDIPRAVENAKAGRPLLDRPPTEPVPAQEVVDRRLAGLLKAIEALPEAEREAAVARCVAALGLPPSA